MAQQPVEPVQTPCPYFGGKAFFAKQILPLIGLTRHTSYCEPFIGMGGVFFRRTHRPGIEVINDFSADVVGLFRVLQHHEEELVRQIAMMPLSRSVFEELRSADPGRLTDVQRAARFVFLQYMNYGALPRGNSFRVMRQVAPVLRSSSIRDRFRRLAQRLDGVVVERLPAAEFIQRYDHPGALFYVDPPYFSNPDTYLVTFTHDDHVQLASVLTSLKGRFLLSIDDSDAARAVYGQFPAVELKARYSLTSGRAQTVGQELVFTNIETDLTQIERACQSPAQERHRASFQGLLL